MHVAVDLYAATLTAVEHFVPRLVPGGIVATDDYNGLGGRQAVDEACELRSRAKTLDVSFANTMIR